MYGRQFFLILILFFFPTGSKQKEIFQLSRSICQVTIIYNIKMVVFVH